MKVLCPVCKKEWEYNPENDKNEISRCLLLVRLGKPIEEVVNIALPTKKGRLTCPKCREEPVREHITPANSLGIHWRESTVKQNEWEE
jgi:uncharacterized protein YbaR (Trm112 family)